LALFDHFVGGEVVEIAVAIASKMKKERPGVNVILFLSTESANADSKWYDSVWN
jgi:hypothetical protein